jgi:hypothetical protein
VGVITPGIGALRNTQATACSKNDQCPREGMFCEVFAGSGRALTSSDELVRPNRCNYCGSATPVPLQLNALTGEVSIGLSRIATLHRRSSTSYHIY